MSGYLNKARDPISSLTHMLGAVFFSIGTLIMIVKCRIINATVTQMLSCIIFGISLIGLYTASAVYHFAPSGKSIVAVLRRLDHSMIYVLIAGTYTTVLMHYNPQPWGMIYTIIIWAIAFSGILVRMLWFSAPRWLYTGFYILMGWFILFDTSVFTVMEPAAIALLASGGISYTLGGIFYALRWPDISKNFGAHEVFHVLVILGSLLHYLIVLLFIL